MSRATARRAPKPPLVPVWTQDCAAQVIASNLAADDISAVATRVAALILARTPDELIASAAKTNDDGESVAKTMSDLLKEGMERLKARLEMMQAAEYRVLWAACVVRDAAASAPATRRRGGEREGAQ
ncbi:hypothetical protein [Reyranella sp.]|uniref:hypothetical protein n=1 Tax=Reyranella sp. TaxID=1929291 RepID=UPI003D133843